ncbi:MAG: hypothetical protein FGM27_09580 [Candidatus Omnitrophica bacterium]|nr:hypothetical protein [Candidatus Omnitrophota bacterium]
MNGYVFSSRDRAALADSVTSFVEMLHERNIPHSAVFRRNFVIVIPIGRPEASEVFGAGGVFEMTGHVYTGLDLYKTATEAGIADFLASFSLPAGDREALVRDFLALRSELREAPSDLGRAVEAAVEMRLEAVKQGMVFRGVENVDEAFGRALGDATLAAAAEAGITVSANAPDASFFVVEYKEWMNVEFIRDMLEGRAKLTVAVHMSAEARDSQAGRTFRSGVQALENRVFIPESPAVDLSVFVSEFLKSKRVLDAAVTTSEVAQLQTAGLTKEAYLKATLLGAVPLAQGRVFIAGEKPVSLEGISVKLVLAERIAHELEVRQSIEASA